MNARALRKNRHPFLLVLAVLAAGAVLALLLRNQFATKEPLDPHVAQLLVSGENRVALEIPGVLQVRYRDLGQRVELAVSAQANPIIVVDENANHLVDAGDLMFQALPGDKVCTGSPLLTETEPCGGVARSARVRVTHNEPWTTATWIISKADLTHGQAYADVVFQVFHGDTQKIESYPAEPFNKVYRLQFLERGGGAGSGSSRLETPRPSPAIRDFTGEAAAPPSAVPSAVSNDGRGSAPEILQFEAKPAVIKAGSPARLQWSVRGVDAVTIDPGIGSVEPQGFAVVAPVANERYLLTARAAGGGTVTREVTVGVAAPGAPVIASFSAESASIQPGGSTRLHWSATGAITRVRLDPIAGSVANDGLQEVSPPQTTEYNLTAEGAGGSVSSTVTVHVAAPSGPLPAAPSISFTAVPATVAPGEPVTLRWHVTGADAVSIEPALGTAAPEGTQIVHPVSNVAYTLTARGKGGVSGRQVAVFVRRPTGPMN